MSDVLFSIKTQPRGYQRRIIHSVGNGNAIVVLPTGSGKTLIACALIAKEQARSGKVLFLVPTRDLVAQQTEYVQRETGVNVIGYRSDVSQNGLPAFIRKSGDFEVLVTTPEALRRMIAADHPIVPLSQFTLVLVDECHHVCKKHPYERVMMLLQSEPNIQKVGLSASLTYKLSTKSQQKDIARLCGYFSTENVLTASNEEMVQDGYHAKSAEIKDCVEFRSESSFPNMKPTKAPLRNGFFQAVENAYGTEFIRQVVTIVKQFEQEMMLLDPGFQSPTKIKGKMGKLKCWGIYCQRRAKGNKNLEHHYLFLQHWYEALRLLVLSFPSPPNPIPVPTDEITHQYLVQHVKDFTSPFELDLTDYWPFWESIFTTDNNRFSRLRGILESHETAQCIIFVAHRISAHVLADFVQEAGFSSAVLYSIRSSVGTFRMNASDTKKAISDFRSGRVQILVATSVAEEGMDIPACSRVIRFDPIQTPVSLVQSRGRARKIDSDFIVMESNPKRNLNELLKAEENQLKIISEQKIKAKAPQLAPKKADNAIAGLHKYCQKNRETMQMQSERKNNLWTVKLRVGDVQSVGTKASKKAAKMMASERLLRELGKELNAETGRWA